MCWNQSCSWYVIHIYVVCHHPVASYYCILTRFFLPLLSLLSSSSFSCSSSCFCCAGVKKGATYLFTQRRTSNYFHPLGFAHGPDGALDDQPELEPSVCFGQTRDGPDLECDCKLGLEEGEAGSCPSPMYFRGDTYLGKYSNNAVVAPLSKDEDFGLDVYEPEFVIPLLQWKTAASGLLFGQDRENYFVALNIPTDIESTGTFYSVV